MNTDIAIYAYYEGFLIESFVNVKQKQSQTSDFFKQASITWKFCLHLCI